MDEEKTKFIVFTAGFNSAHWVRKNIFSVQKQRYSNYLHVIVDDATTDYTNIKIRKYKHKKIRLYRNEENLKWVRNAKKYIDKHIENEEDVIVIVDLDDWLAHENVLSILNQVYTEKDVWLTYGNYAIYTGSKFKHITPSTERSGAYIHLRTFKAFLWQNLNKHDLKGPDGEYIPCTYDRAIMYPMLDMCPDDKIHKFKEVHYIYNSGNTLNVGNVMRKKQIELKKWFLNKPKYKVLKR